MSLSVGIVGLPNAGKSTLFNALLQKQQALVASYPFATIEPNVGIVPVTDSRLEKLANVIAVSHPEFSSGSKTTKKDSGSVSGMTIPSRPPIIPSTVKFVDIAGLVKGAHQGEGLGNKFLSHIREVSLIVHVLRKFNNPDVAVTGEGDPLNDFETVKTELILADLATVTKQPEPKGSVSPEDKTRWAAIQLIKSALDQGKEIRSVAVTDEQKHILDQLFLLTAKPALFILNIDEQSVSRYQTIEASFTLQPAIALSAKMEAELVDFSPEERAIYLKDQGLTQTGLDRLVQIAFDKLSLTSFLTAGKKEVRSWTIPQGTKAPEAAGIIHTDFAKNFIKAQVVNYQDFIKAGGWRKAREQGLVRTEGREYVMQPNDVVEFMIGN